MKARFTCNTVGKVLNKTIQSIFALRYIHVTYYISNSPLTSVQVPSQEYSAVNSECAGVVC